METKTSQSIINLQNYEIRTENSQRKTVTDIDLATEP